MKTPRFKMTRRRFLGGVSVAAAGTFAYARWFETRRLQTSRVTVPLASDGRAPLKLLHLSDLHASPVVNLSYIESALARALEWKPDVICVTGDFITQRFDEPERYAKILRRLSDAAPCFATLGNHDGGLWAGQCGGYADVKWISDVLRDGKISLLQNTAAQIRVRDWPIQFVGVGDVWARTVDPTTAFRAAKSGSTTILLSHNPDAKDDLAPFHWDLMLCGHTHGGQLRVPWLGATPFAPVQDKRFVAGLHRWSKRWMHITKGIGNVYGLRINCPPEVSFLTLT
jgi:predicted MPP superfamily phosphohydrolase